jgi:Transposase IS116/IS110/IS902 family
MTTNKEVHESIRPLLKLSRDMISRSQKLDYALVSSLQRDPVLKERLRRLRTVPGVGPITALTWALEIGDYTRFPSIKQAISYCGLCGDEKSSAEKVMRMPISKQRNKHIQRVLIEAAKLAPSESPELALTHARELEKGNRNRATLAVARKMVCYMLAVERRQQDFVPAEEFSRPQGESTNIGIHERAGCQVPPIADWARDHIPRPLWIVSGLAENTNSIICDGSSSLRQQMDVRSCRDAGTTSREALMRSEGS